MEPTQSTNALSFSQDLLHALADMDGNYWMAEISGKANDLERLIRFFPGLIAKKHNRYYLTSQDWKDCQEPEKVEHLAEEKLELINAFAKLHSGVGDATKVTVSAVVYVDSDGKHHAHTTLTVRVRVGVVVEIMEPAPERWIFLAENNRHLDMAVRLWGETPRTWPKLYRILEDICYSFETEWEYPSKVLFENELVADKVTVLRFVNSANDHSVSGRDARHAKNKKIPKELKRHPNPTMTYTDAVDLVRTILIKALNKTAQQFNSA